MQAFRPAIAWIIFAKEFRESLRDRKTLVMMILFPFFLYPALSILGINLLMQQEVSFRQRTMAVACRRPPGLPQLEKFLKRQPDVRLMRPADPDRALARGQLQCVLDVQPGAAAALQMERGFKIQIRFDQADFASMRAAERIETALRRWRRELLLARLKRHGLPRDFADPVQATPYNIASPQRVRGFLVGGFIPTIMIMMLLMGGFYPAIDLTAGERERSTLETLMTAPISRLEIMAGKFLAVFAFMLLTGAFNLVSLGLSTYYVLLVGAGSVAVPTMPPIGGMLLILMLLIPTAWLFSGVLIAVASLAKGFKDAQNYLTPLYMACSLPAMVAMIPGYQLNTVNALVPVANIALLSRQLLLGEWSPRLLFLTLAANCLYAAVAVVLAARLFHQESLLSEQNLSTRLLLPGAETPGAVPSASSVVTLLLLEFILLYYAGGYLQLQYELGGVVLTMWGVFGLPVLIFLNRTGASPELALGLRPCNWRYLAAAACLAFPLMLVANGLLYWQNLILPVPKDLEQEIMRFALPGDTAWSLLAVLFGIALSPAVCEELLFRGLVLRSFQPVMTPARAVVLSALLFALFHLSLYRLMPVFVLGLALGALAVISGSIFPGMVLHGLYNGTAVLVAAAAHWGLPEEAVLGWTWIWVPGVVLTVIGGWLLQQSKTVH